MLSAIDAALQKDLLDFVKKQESIPYPHTLRDAILTMVLKEIINGNARISGYAKNDNRNTAYIELTFWENEEQETAADEKH